MNLTDTTIKIKYFSKSIVNNFIEIGQLLHQVRDQEVFKEKYENFTDYLKTEHPNLSLGFVSKLLQVVEDPQLVSTSKMMGICKTMELVYVPDREKREELTERALKEDMTTKEIREEVKRTKINPTRVPELDTQEEWKYKCINEYNRFKESIVELQKIYRAWRINALKYNLTDEVKELDELWNQ